MIATLINVLFASGLSILAYYNLSWNLLILSWLVFLLGGLTIISLFIKGMSLTIKKQWYLGAVNFVMLIPLIYFLIPIFSMIGV